MERKTVEQMAFNIRPKSKELMLVIMNKSTHEELLSQQLQTNNRQFKTSVFFLPGYKRIFDVTNKNNKFFFTKSFQDDVFTQIAI